jgi:tetratricopeptide (TPR) repeat protein
MGPLPDAWSLTMSHGYVRVPEAYAALGRIWALSGQRDLASVSLNRALTLKVSQSSNDLRRVVAVSRLLQQQTGETPEVVEEILADDPSNQGALVALAQAAQRSGDREEVLSLLQRVRSQGLESTKLTLSVASVYSSVGALAEAREVLEELLADTPGVLEAWTMLGGIAVEQGDGETVRRCLRKVEALEGRHGYCSLSLRAMVALGRHDLQAARGLLDRALELRKDDGELLERSLRLDYLLGARRSTADRARALLTVDAENAFGWYVLGSFQIRQGEYDLAEDSLRRSVANRRTAEALNDLAWVLQERGAYKEAESLAREALTLDEELAAAWDTLGLILMKSGRPNEAEDALMIAVRLAPENSAVRRRFDQVRAGAARKVP